MKKMTLKRLYIYVLPIAFLLISNISWAHEPIYGLGPETLPKHLHAIEFGTLITQGQLVYELSYGYGITENFTVHLDATLNNEAHSGFKAFNIKTKFAIWRKLSPGISKKLTVITAINLPTNKAFSNLYSDDVTAYTLGLANGYESRRWYYFSDISYTYFQAKRGNQVGGKLKYNLVGGIRPVKSDYLKPDLVILVELNGEFRGKSHFTDELQQPSGNTLAVAPGFLFSYRNIMLKGGVQFGIANTKNINRPKTNGRVTLEYHF